MAQTTPFILTQRKTLYPHDQNVSDTPVKTVSAIYKGADVAAYKGSAVAINDVAQLITIPAGAFLLTVTHKVITAEGATCTYSIGDGAGTAGYVSAADGNTAVDASSFNGTTTPTFGVGKYYAAADTLDLLLASGTAAKLVVKVSATYILTAPVAA